jgi:DNA-binding MarR family transcriptional regulator
MSKGPRVISLHPRRQDVPSTLGNALDFMRLLMAVNDGLTQVSKRMERQLGVSGLERLVIRVVGRNAGISAGGLARTLHVRPSTLTGVLKALTRRGVLERRSDPADGRRSLFHLTRKGMDVDAVRTGTAEARIRVALSGAPDADLDAAGRILTRVAAALGAG